MHIQFCGANREVTGSCHLIETNKKRILIDCGLFQGSNYAEGKNFDNFPFDPASIDILLVTHAHLDHIGRIPKLVHDGFQGKIISTKGTCAIMQPVLEDAWQIMVYNNKKFQTPILYDEKDIQDIKKYCNTEDYNTRIDLGDGDFVVFKDAGHIFGSAFLELHIEGKNIAFSGDIGNENVPILKDTASLGEIDILVCESTYGDRIHETVETRDEIILSQIHASLEKGGTMMVPAFSTERTQELLYTLNKLSEQKKLPNLPVFVDSPLAIEITKIFKEFPEYYDNEASTIYMAGDDFLHFPHLHMTYTKDESKLINDIKPPKMIIAGAGMMNGGRILHHAHRYLSDPKSTLLIVGYQAEGTLGRKLYEGAEAVTIFGDEIPVRCHIQAIGALSAHGDQKKLLSWIQSAKKLPEKIYYVHGETHAATELSHKVKHELGISGFIPEYKERIEI